MEHLYLSPHLDDAALSCGGTIFRQTQAGQRVVVINIFAGIPDYRRLSAFARKKHADWGNPDDVMAARRAEDQAALTLLGAHAVHWDFLDAIYRVGGTRVLYPDRDAIFAEVDPADGAWLLDQLTADVEKVLDDLEEATCYAPLSIGHHVDHQVVRDVGLALRRRGRRVVFYEDFPYVWWAGRDAAGEKAVPGVATAPPTQAAPAVTRWAPSVHAIEVEAKVAAIARYTSQVVDLFGSEQAMAAAVREYAGLAGGGLLAERFWHPVRIDDE